MPYLIAITPRAGCWNHRYLVPPGLNLNTETLGRLTRMASKQAQGAAWLAVSREVMQIGSGRSGQEMLILGDLDVQKLDAAERERLLDRLRQRLQDLDHLITQQIDWEREGRVDPVKRSELSEWYNADFFPLGLQESHATDWGTATVGVASDMKVKTERKKRLLTGSAVGLVGLLLVTVFYLMKTQSKQEEKVAADFCTISNVKGRIKDSACFLSQSDVKQVCEIFVSMSDSCNIREVEKQIKNVRKLREGVDLSAVAGQSVGSGKFNSELVLTKEKTGEAVRFLSEEIFGKDHSGGQDITLNQYIEILKFESNIVVAWQALRAFRPEYTEHSSTLPGKAEAWTTEHYSSALRDIRVFLDEYPKLPSVPKYIEKDCFLKKVRDTPISVRLECIKQDKLESLKREPSQSTDDQNAILLFEGILNLKSALPYHNGD